MIMKRRIMAIVAVTCAMVLTNTFAAEMAASSGAVVPGEWNSHFYAGKAYAEANNVPMLLFWANPGCGNCEKMISAVKTTEFKSWMASSGYVFVFVEGATTKEKSDAKDFAWNDSKKFPYMSVYFPTSEGWARYNFSGLSAKMPSKVGSGLAGKLISSVELIVSGKAGGAGAVSGEWQHARKVSLSADDDNGWCQGRAEVSLGKAKSSTSVSSVKATVELFSGKKIKFSGKVTASSRPFSFTKSGYTLTLTSAASGVSGTLTGPSGRFTLRTAAFGGAVAVSRFSIENPPATYGNDKSPVLTQFLGAVAISSGGGRWKLPAGGTVRWSSGAFVATSAANPASLKLTYKSSTGVFTGKFFVYAQTGAQKVKKLTAKVNGCVVDGVGYGGAVCTGLATMKVIVR